MDDDTVMLICAFLIGLLIGGLFGFDIGVPIVASTNPKVTIVNPPPLNITIQNSNQSDSNAISNVSTNFPFQPIYLSPSRVPEGITDCTHSPIVVTSSVINIVVLPEPQYLSDTCNAESSAEEYTFISATPLHSGIDTFAIHIVDSEFSLTRYMTIIIPTPVPVQHLTVNIYIETGLSFFYGEVISTSVTVSGT